MSIIILQSIYLLILTSCANSIVSEPSSIFDSVSHVEKAFITEKNFPSFVKYYLKLEKERLQQIKELAKIYKDSELVITEDEDTFLENPINIFHLVKRLNLDIEPLLELMNYTTIYNTAKEFFKNDSFSFPDYNDIVGIVESLNNIVRVYNISISSLAKSELIPGIKTAQELSAFDCYQIGQLLYENNEFLKAIPWLKESIARIKTDTPKHVDIVEIYETLSNAYFLNGEYNKGLMLLEEYFKIDINDEKLKFQYDSNKKFKQSETKLNIQESDYFNENHLKYSESYKSYRQLCQSKIQQKGNNSSFLKCYFYRNKSAYLTLQPVKVEDVHHDPWIAIYHDIIHDNEIDIIKNLSVGKIISDSLKGEQDIQRLSKSTWVADDEHQIIAAISKRLEAITGLKILKSAEDLEVVNYGVGGHCRPHVDYEMDSNLPKNNRLATILFYLSDVEVGGETVFPKLNLKITPMKRSAVFWFNLLMSGLGNSLTEHAACPVIIGNKWVANKWIHQFNQEFRRPCNISINSLFDKSPIEQNSFLHPFKYLLR